MRLSKTSEYALRILGYMINSDQQIFSAKYLIEKLKIPDRYLRRLMTSLSKKELIKSIQGRDGGYYIAKDASKILLWDIINAVEGIDNYTECILGFNKCLDNNPCVLHNVYAPVKKKLLDFLSTNSLADLKNEKVDKF